jgi:hypothetical protein
MLDARQWYCVNDDLFAVIPAKLVMSEFILSGTEVVEGGGNPDICHPERSEGSNLWRVDYYVVAKR